MIGLRVLAAAGPKGVTNLLTATQASFEDGTTGWAATAGATLSQSSTVAAHGTYSMLYSTTGGNATAATPGGTSGFRVDESATYTFQVSGYRPTASASVAIITYLNWYTSGGSSLGISSLGNVSAVADTWTVSGNTVVAPSTAYYARLYCSFQTPTSGNSYYVDKCGVWLGSSTEWAMP